jgi:hypothetical protein
MIDLWNDILRDSRIRGAIWRCMAICNVEGSFQIHVPVRHDLVARNVSLLFGSFIIKESSEWHIEVLAVCGQPPRQCVTRLSQG